MSQLQTTYYISFFGSFVSTFSTEQYEIEKLDEN